MFMKKSRLQKEGIDREALFQDGQWLDIYNYGIFTKRVATND